MFTMGLEPSNLGKIVQRVEDPLYFDFLFQPGEARSEELKEWFEFHKVKYFVAEWFPEGAIEYAGVSFRDYPDLAVLFKLRFL